MRLLLETALAAQDAQGGRGDASALLPGLASGGTQYTQTGVDPQLNEPPSPTRKGRKSAAA